MKWLVILLGAIVLILGLAPLIDNLGYWPIFLDFIPRDGSLYNGLIAICGGILTYLGIKKL